nr:uncharacterized protein LOC117986119 [Maniola hyperantus]
MEESHEKDFTITNTTKTSWTPLLRQMFVCSGVTVNYLIYGLFFGAPTVFVPQIRKEANSTEVISMETASWLLSISSYGSLPLVLIFPIIAERYGRKGDDIDSEEELKQLIVSQKENLKRKEEQQLDEQKNYFIKLCVMKNIHQYHE